MPLRLVIVFFSCLLLINPIFGQSIEGLWSVTSVIAGDQEMTPNARWMQFNADGSQESGNGWTKHSVGNWNFDVKKNALTVINTNGLTDENGPFSVTFSENSMVWNRLEDGQEIKVKLQRIDKLPSTLGDDMLGLWMLEKTEGEGPFFTSSDNPMGIIHFKWNKRFLIGTENGKVHGVYNFHGHKPEVELIPYGNQLTRSFWSVEKDDQKVVLQQLNADGKVTRTFHRIYAYPE